MITGPHNDVEKVLMPQNSCEKKAAAWVDVVSWDMQGKIINMTRK